VGSVVEAGDLGAADEGLGNVEGAAPEGSGEVRKRWAASARGQEVGRERGQECCFAGAGEAGQPDADGARG